MVMMRYGLTEVPEVQAAGSAISGFSLIDSVYNSTYTFTSSHSNVLICGTSGRSSEARSEISTTAQVTASGYWRTSGTQGSLAVLYCPSVSPGDTVTITNGYGYPCIFILQI